MRRAGQSPTGPLGPRAVGGGQGQLERGFVSNAGAVEVGRRDALLVRESLDLRRCPMDKHNADAQGAQHGNIDEDVGEVLVRDDRAIDVDDERPLGELRDVLQDAPWTSTTRMLRERNTAISTRMLAKFSSVTIAPSTLCLSVRWGNCGMYCRMPHGQAQRGCSGSATRQYRRGCWRSSRP